MKVKPMWALGQVKSKW